MTHSAKRMLKIGLGWALLLLGLVGLVLPFLQGVLFLVLGLLVLGQVQRWPRVLLARMSRRFPRLGVGLQRARVRASLLLRRWFS